MRIDEIDRRGFLRSLGRAAGAGLAAAAVPALAQTQASGQPSRFSARENPRVVQDQLNQALESIRINQNSLKRYPPGHRMRPELEQALKQSQALRDDAQAWLAQHGSATSSGSQPGTGPSPENRTSRAINRPGDF